MNTLEIVIECHYEKKQAETRITIRFPSELIEKLREIAPENGRSLNGEVVQAVREHIKQQTKKQ